MIKIFLNLPIWVRWPIFLSMSLVYAYFGPNIDLPSRVLPALIMTAMTFLCLSNEAVVLLARYFHSRQKDEEVLIICDQAHALMPGNYNILLEKHYALMALKRYEEAKTCADRAAEIAPKVWLTWYGSALAALWMNDYKGAAASAAKAMELAPCNSYCLAARAAARSKDDPQGCLEDCARLQQLGKASGTSRMLSSRVHIEAANFQAAREVIDRIPKRFEPGSNDAAALAFFKFSQNQFSEVLIICGQIPDAQRAADWFLNMQAASYNRLNEGALALESISRSIAILPDQSRCYKERALVLADAGLFNQALTGCKRGQVLGNKSSSRKAEAYVRFRLGEFAEMLECTQPEIAKSPKSAYVHALHSLALAGLGRIDEAKEEAVKATELHDLEALAWYALANVYFKREQFDQAITSLDTGLAADPHYRFSYQLRAEAHRCAGHETEADRDQSKFDQLERQFMANINDA